MIDLNNNKRLYYSISEVALHFGVNESLLRYWEKEFKEIKPQKSKGGTRRYRKEDIEQIALIYNLVKEKGLKIENAKIVLRSNLDEEMKRLTIIKELESIRQELINLEKAFSDNENLQS